MNIGCRNGGNMNDLVLWCVQNFRLAKQPRPGSLRMVNFYVSSDGIQSLTNLSMTLSVERWRKRTTGHTPNVFFVKYEKRWSYLMNG